MTKTRSRFLLTLAVLACCLSSVSAKPQANKLPEWKPTPELLTKLSAPVQVEAGSLRVPKGFEQEREEAPHGLMYVWSKKAGQGGGDQAFFVTIPSLTPEQFRTHTLQIALEDLLIGYRRSFDQWKQTPAQLGMINKAEAIRLHWSGINRKRKVKTQGSVFIVKTKTDYIVMVSILSDKDQAGLRITEAAALTFKPK